MKNYTDLIEQSHALFEKAKNLLGDENATVEQKQHIPEILEDARKLKAEAAQLKEIEQALSEGIAEMRTKAKRDDGQAKHNDPGEFKSLGSFLKSVSEAGDIRYRGPLDTRLKIFKGDGAGDWKESDPQWEEKATMVESVGARGGFLVPTEYSNMLMAVDPMRTPVRQRATIIPMRRAQVKIPVLDQTSTTAGQAHWFGGMQATWTQESGTKTQSDPTFRQVILTARKLICYTRSSDELLDDEAVGLAAFLAGPMGFSGAIDWYTEYAFLQGTGAGQPLGIINAGATITVNATASPPAPASLYNDLVNMLENFLPGASGVWFINQRHLSDVMTMNGPTGNASYLWGNAVDGPNGTLLGYPVVWTEKLPAPGTSGSILLADPKYYLVGDRQATTVESTNIERFQYDETSWRAVHRVDGQPWLSTPITLADGTAQVSPFVILGAKST